MKIYSKLLIAILFIFSANSYVIEKDVLADIVLVEKGDLVFRSNATFDVLPGFPAYIGHTAVYYEWDGEGNHFDPSHHYLVEATKNDPNYPVDRVNYTSYYHFLNAEGATWVGAGTKNPSWTQRTWITGIAFDQIGKPYDFTFGYKGPYTFRCDGVAEYSYENTAPTMSLNIVDDTGWTTLWPLLQFDSMMDAVGTPPNMIVTITSSSSACVTVDDGPTGSGLTLLEVFWGGQLRQTWTGVYNRSNTYPITGLPMMTQITLNAYDQAGNLRTKSFTTSDATLKMRRVERKTVFGEVKEIIGNPVIHVEGTMVGGSTVIVEASTNGGEWAEIGSTATLPYDLNWNTTIYPENTLLRVRGRIDQDGTEQMIAIVKENVGDESIEPFQEPDGASKEMTIDNNCPMVQSLRVGSLYEGIWTWDGSRYNFSANTNPVPNGEDYILTLTLSEPCTLVRIGFHLISQQLIDIAISPEFPIKGQEVGFVAAVNRATGACTYIWNFGDGVERTTNEPVIKHIWENSGTYTVRVTVRDSRRIEQTKVKEITVIPDRHEINGYTLDFSHNPESPGVQQQIDFQGAFISIRNNINNINEAGNIQISPIDLNEIKYEWNYGDGSSPQITKLPQTSWIYQNGGSYPIRMSIKDKTNELGYIAKAIRINTNADAVFSSETTAETVKYVGNCAEVRITKRFNAGSSKGILPILYKWEFGDGANVATTSPEVNHTYLIKVLLDKGGEETAWSKMYRIALNIQDVENQTDTESVAMSIGYSGPINNDPSKPQDPLNPPTGSNGSNEGDKDTGLVDTDGRIIKSSEIGWVTGVIGGDKANLITISKPLNTESVSVVMPTLISNDGGINWTGTMTISGVESPTVLQFVVGDVGDPDLAGNRYATLDPTTNVYVPAIKQWNGDWNPPVTLGNDTKHCILLVPGGGPLLDAEKQLKKEEKEQINQANQVNQKTETIKIIEPSENKKISGNAVSVIAESSKEIEGYVYQYKSTEQNEWIEIGKSREGIYWNTSGLKEGQYQIRAISRGDNSKIESILITVTIDKSNAEIVEEDTAIGHKKEQKLNAGEGTNIAMTDGTLVIVPAMTKSNVLKIEKMDLRGVSEAILPPVESTTKPVGIFYRCEMDGTKDIEKTITLNVPYKDEDGDGIIDGTKYKAEKVKLYYLNESTGEWKQLPTNIYSSINKSPSLSNVSKALYKSTNIAANINKFTDRTLFGLFARVPASDLNNIIVYPNPFKPNSGLGHTNIIFDGLTENIKVRLYSISGRLVKTIEGTTDGRYEWDCKNDEGENIASGVYIYIATNNKGETKKGKIAIIR